MEKALLIFEGLIRRSIAPSITLLVLAMAVDLALAEYTGGSALARGQDWLDSLREASGVASGVFMVVVLLLILGMSYSLTAVQQILFDNRLKKNFNPGKVALRLKFLGSVESEDKALKELRKRVFKRLDNLIELEGHKKLNERSDYLLYEILGGIDPTDTRAFVDSAKAIGITCISIILAFLGGLVFYWGSLNWLAKVFLVLGSIISYWLGREATLAQYRARALRLYVNFLMMPAERIWRRLLGPEVSLPKPPATPETSTPKPGS